MKSIKTYIDLYETKTNKKRERTQQNYINDTKIKLLQIHHSGICFQLTWIYDFVLKKNWFKKYCTTIMRI